MARTIRRVSRGDARLPLTFQLSDADVVALGQGEPVQRDDLLSAEAVQHCLAQVNAHDEACAFRRASTAGAHPTARSDRTAWESDLEGLAPESGIRGLAPEIGIRGLAPESGIRGRAPEVRGLPALRALFVEVREALNEAAWMGLATLTIQLAIYDGDGARYLPHRDAIRGNPARRATAIVYLNPGWQPSDGGCLRVHPPSGSRDIEPVGGRLVLFRSDCLLHEVLPSHARRVAATAWYRGRSADLVA